MFVQQIYTNCLAHAAYYIESGNEAAVIDPLRDPAPYIKLAKERGATIGCWWLLTLMFIQLRNGLKALHKPAWALMCNSAAKMRRLSSSFQKEISKRGSHTFVGRLSMIRTSIPAITAKMTVGRM